MRTLKLVALMVIGLLAFNELHGRLGFDATLKALEERRIETIGASGLQRSDCESAVRGFPLRWEQERGQTRDVTYWWPSLISTFRIGLRYDFADKLLAIEDGANDERAPTAAEVARSPVIRDLPQHGLDADETGVVALDVQEVDAQNPLGDDGSEYRTTRGVLVRELVRQAFLLTARDELQCPARDGALWDDVWHAAEPGNFPFQLHTTIRGDGVVQIEIIHYSRTKARFQRQLETIHLSTDHPYESLLEGVERLSRHEFRDVLAESGFKGRANSFGRDGGVSPEAEESLARFDELSQLNAIRLLHGQIRTQGETPARLGALSQA